MNNGRQFKVMKLTICLPMDFPADWDDDMINFYQNESSSCASNRINDLYKYDKKYGCICSITHGEVLPEKFKNEEEANDAAIAYINNIILKKV